MNTKKKCPKCGDKMTRLYFRHVPRWLTWGFMCYGCGLLWNDELKNPARLTFLEIEEEMKSKRYT